jgi:hypothetical protein
MLAPWRRSSGVDEYPFFECHRKWTAAFDPTETSSLIAFDTGWMPFLARRTIAKW